jgi:hypothetical protein
MKKDKKQKQRNALAVHSHMRNSAGFMKNSSSKRKPAKKKIIQTILLEEY